MNLWLDDFGEYEIPDIGRFLTKSGWFDGRRKVTPSLREYFAANLRKRQAAFLAGDDLDDWLPPPLPKAIQHLIETGQ